ncbi:MAG: hypothetical protein QOD41_695 [Cryptosporangiaceae bacterium]|nr:hypothetical protein [Cryptosporangiaceae bacterium]
MTDAPATPPSAPRRRARWIATAAGAATLVAGAGIASAGPASAGETATAGGTASAPALPASITAQKLAWTRCTPDLPATYQCATIKVPVDYQRPAGATLDLAISRYATSVPGKRHGILTFNPGGPGGSGLDMPVFMNDELPQSVRDQFDLVGFDPRGVGASSPITCNLTGDETSWLNPYKPQTFAKDVARARTVASKCAKAGSTIPYITTRNTARDMDVLRTVLGEKKLSYLGYSYGTYLGAVYAQLFGSKADRIVLDSSVDPALAWRGMVQSWAVGSKPAYDRWARFTAAHDAKFHLGTTPDAVGKVFWGLVAIAEKKPINYMDSDWTGDEIRFTSRSGVFFPAQLADFVAGLKQAAAGQPVSPASGSPAAALVRLTRSTAAAKATRTAVADPPADNGDAMFMAIVCNDVTNWPRNPETYRRDAIRDKKRYPLAGDVTSNILPCAFWTVPHTEKSSVVANRVPIMTVQNEWDPQTPLYTGLGMHRALKGSRLVFVDEGEGHGVYSSAGNTCAYAAVNAYLSTGTLPATDVTCKADPAPQTKASLLPMDTFPGLPNRF